MSLLHWKSPVLNPKLVWPFFFFNLSAFPHHFYHLECRLPSSLSCMNPALHSRLTCPLELSSFPSSSSTDLPSKDWEQHVFLLTSSHFCLLVPQALPNNFVLNWMCFLQLWLFSLYSHGILFFPSTNLINMVSRAPFPPPHVS